MECLSISFSRLSSTITSCSKCDTLVTIPVSLSKDEKLSCPCCGYTLAEGRDETNQDALALAVTVSILLLLACIFPFLSFEAQGQQQTIYLYNTASQLVLDGYFLLGLCVFAFIVLLPSLYIFLVTVLLYLSWRKRFLNVAKQLATWTNHILPWNMPEVFLTGVLVALIKIIALADIKFGIGFYSYLLFSVLFLRLTQIIDVSRIWRWIDRAEGKTNA